MKLKRVLAVSAACAVAAAGISVQAGAAGRFRLLTEPMGTVDGAIDVEIPNNGIREYMALGYHNDEVNGIDGLFDITADDLDSWRETGEFIYTQVEGDFDFDRDARIFNDCLGMCYLDAEGNIAERFAVRYDGEGKLDITKQSEDYFYPTLDGWILEEKEVKGEEQSTLTITATSPDGKTISKEIQYDTYCFTRYVSNDKYLGYIMYATGSTEPDYEEYIEMGMRNWDVRVDALNSDGELENIYSGMANNWGITNAADNYFEFMTQVAPVTETYSIFYPDTGEVLSFKNFNDVDRIGIDELCERFGDKIVVKGKPFGSDETHVGYYLVEFEDDQADPGKHGTNIVSDEYKSMSTKDGELYLVKTLDDKWGFMNADGELLATYDDASSFIGKYAPVIKDGKAFLINRDFKRVSEKIDAEAVGTIDKGLYYVTINGEKYFMTYAAAQEEQTEKPEQTEPEDKPEEPAETTEPSKSAETSEPSKPVEPEQPDTTSESAQTAEAAGDNSGDNGADKTNPDTGAASAAAVLGLGVIAAGAVILSRKRR